MTLRATFRKQVLLAACVSGFSVAAEAHPHVWVSVKTSVLYGMP